MANWCGSDYEIRGNEKEIDRLYRAVKKAAESGKIKNSFGPSWLGHLLEYLGYPEKEIVYGNIRCRGYITWMERVSDCVLCIDTETAWSTQPDALLQFVEKYAPNAEVLFTSEECGVGYYASNRPDFAGCYNVDVWTHTPELDVLTDLYVVSEKGLKPVLEELLGVSKDIKELIALAEAKYDGLSINKWEIIDVYDAY